jgi:hypothetical protein
MMDSVWDCASQQSFVRRRCGWNRVIEVEGAAFKSCLRYFRNLKQRLAALAP